VIRTFEAVNRFVIREEHPAGGEVESWVTCAQVTEINNAAKGATVGEDVGWVQIPMDPDRWSGPSRRGDCVLPDRLDSVWVRNQPQLDCGCQRTGDTFRNLRQRSSSTASLRRPGRSRPVQGGKEGG
jgi:hypothetical protein